FGRYETDYWALSIRQGVEWLEREGILSQDRPEPVVIATNMFYPLRRLTYKYGDDKVQIKYLRWERRCDDTWDYAFYTSRFVSGASLQKDAWPPSNTAHTISADGVPLLAILKNDANDCAEGMQALKNNDIETAIAALQRETARNSDNEVAWTGLATALLNAQRLDEMKQAAEKALSITPDETQASNLIGMYYMYQNRNAEAKAHFEKSLRQEPANAGAWYYLAVIASNQRDFSGALNCLNKATEVNPNFRMAYELAANIYEQQGNPQRAAQIRAAVQNMR
ncbi:MAG: tetratricopeptide repeat protein, partial [Saprospiraceae bacterium]